MIKDMTAHPMLASCIRFITVLLCQFDIEYRLWKNNTAAYLLSFLQEACGAARRHHSPRQVCRGLQLVETGEHLSCMQARVRGLGIALIQRSMIIMPSSN